MEIYIYKITNTINSKQYIGKSKNVKQRFKEHIYNSTYPTLKDKPFYADINKYGYIHPL